MVIKMKYLKYTLIIIPIISLTACHLANTPTSIVEDYLTKYQKLDKDVEKEIKDVVENSTVDDSEKERYKKIIKKGYQNLTYKIKDEKIDGNLATVEVQIEVLDYKKIVNNSDITTRIDDLEKASETINYTINFELSKDDSGNWILNPPSSSDIKKIQGMY